MGELRVEAEGTTLAEVATVWALVADANTYAQWGPWNDSGYDLQPRARPAQGPSSGSASLDAQRLSRRSSRSMRLRGSFTQSSAAFL
jgi:hypothetical protein